MTSPNAVTARGLHCFVGDLWRATASIATLKGTDRAEDCSFGVSRRRDFPSNRRVKEVGLDAPLTGEGAVAHNKLGAADAALRAVMGRMVSRRFPESRRSLERGR